MHKTLLESFFERMDLRVYFLLIIFIQVIFIFQGLDFADAGFDATFYRRIFSDPATVQYNFMYWFTGIMGGLWLKFFSGWGLLGIRFLGVVFTTLALGVTYNLLKKHLSVAALRLSLLLIVLFLTTAIKEFNYDDVTALFFVCAAWFLFNGLTKNNSLLIVLAGVFVALNMFSRIPNIADLALMVVIWFAGWLNHKKIKEIIYQSLFFMAGFFVMSLLLIFLMKYLHHDVVFLNSVALMRHIASGKEDTHSIYMMLKLYIVHYVQSLAMAIVVFVVLLSTTAAWGKLKKEIPATIRFLPFVKYLILLFVSAIFIYRAKRDPDFYFYLLMFYVGAGIIVGFLIVIGKQPIQLRILAAIGLVMVLVLPLGSNFILTTVGKYSLWIILPVAIDYLLKINAINSHVQVTDSSVHSYDQLIGVGQLSSLRFIGIYLTLVFLIGVSYFYPYFDRSVRTSMTYTVDNDRMKGIYTTKTRATVINQLLAESKKYVKPDDYVLAYDCIPMFYYLTETKPFLHNSWNWLYDPVVFKEELDKSLEETNVCPVVIIQKRGTIGNSWPDSSEDDYEFKIETLAYMSDLFETYHYRQVWENDFFKILIPGNRTP